MSIPQRDRGREPSDDGFAQLVREHGPDVLALARSILGNHHDAEDVAQETFLAALDNLDRLRDPGRFGPWVLMIARRASWRRLKERRHVVPLESAPELETGGGDEPRFSERDITLALGALKARHRTALLLFHREGKPHGEVARLMGASAAQVRNWIHRARRTMRAVLVAEGRRRERGEAP